jgi:hypothetical protein
MMFYVDQEIRPPGNTSVQYNIIDESNTMIGTVRIDFKKGHGIWTYRDMTGRRIRSKDLRERMSKAVNHYMDHQYSHEHG